MTKRTWLITGVSSGFGRAMTTQLLESGNTVIGTVRNTKKVQDLIDKYPERFICEILDVTDVSAIHELVNRIGAEHQIDVLVNNAGYGLFGAAEELSDEDVEKILATDLTGSIQMIRSVLPFMRKQNHGQIIQISSYGGQVAFAGNSMYHAAKFGIEGFCESVAQEVAQFNIGMTIVEPGGARTEFRYGSAHVANLMKEYDNNPAHAFLKMLDPANGLAPGDPARMAARIVESVDNDDMPLHMVLGSQALQSTIETMEKRLTEYKSETDLSASTDFPEGE
ncbi:SDR family oxidoreductase [Companilactobacillus nuruki]|uniref:Short-chain dehydrogenase/reductase n=1 Tax=Companilactobacillus nuruki TaxID=1993540 RepID=A0A2N7AW84_9LACO|nr:SDR family oxidoreductase [Companilactobacillus nuruki]PMD73015.1 short-chain dehydrogenase/reductase [Companilactobacillus nuruki]